MTDVTVTALGDHRFGVEVVEGGRVQSSHTVTVPEGLLVELGLGPEDGERLVRASFGFLLERERPAEILREFPLGLIERYFPDYRAVIAARLAG